MNRFAMLLTIILLTLNCSAELFADGESPEEVLLRKAEQSFSRGNEYLVTDPSLAEEAYREAVGYYSSLIESGIANSGVYYNLANSYVRMNRTGEAILNYRRALLFAPNDVQIRANLDYARSLQKNGFNLSAENEVLNILFFWHYRIPLLWKVIVLAAANIFFWGSLILRFFGRKFTKASIISLVILLVFCGSIAADISSSRVLHGVVTAESTVGRLGDSLSYEPAFDEPLHEGVEFRILQRRVGWLLAELPDSSAVWIEDADCEIVEEIPR